MRREWKKRPQKVLVLASVASMIDQFNMPNIRLLQEMGCEVHAACNFREGNTCDQRQIERLKGRLHKMHAARHQWDCPRDIRSVRKCIRAYRQLLYLMEKHHFAWMHCQSPVGGALARLAAHRAGVPVVYTAHGFHFYKGAPLKNWLAYYPAERLLAHWTDVLITVNREDYRLASRRLKAGKIYYTPGIGIDTKRFRDLPGACGRSAGRASAAAPPDAENAGRFEAVPDGADAVRASARKEFCRQYRIPENAWILLSVGELSRRKNHRIVLDALARLGRRDIYYVICGQGKLKEALTLQAEKLGITAQVRLTGYQEDVDVLYRNADIFVFPSLQEGMPAALMEAMAAGLPCVVSDIRGNRELIGRGILACGTGTGLCRRILRQKHRSARRPAEGGSLDRASVKKAGGVRFSLKHPQQMALALDMLLRDARLRKKCGMRNKKVIQSYGLQKVQPVMKKIYEEMADQEGMGALLCR